LRPGRSGSGRRGGRGRRTRRRRRGLDITPHDAAAGPGSLEEPEINAGLGCDLAGERRGLDSAVASRRLGGRGRHGDDRVGRRRGLVGFHGGQRIRPGGGGSRARGGRRRRGPRKGSGGNRADIVGRIGDDPDHVPHRNLPTLSDHDLPQDASAKGLDFHVGLVRLNLRDDVTALDGIAFLLEPLDDLPRLHRVAELGHQDLGDHAQTFRMAAAILAFDGVLSSSRFRA
jgi:hypothetical protein